jgi:acyl-CoA dehydrogenase
MKRDSFSPDHELFRDQFKRFVRAEVVPHIEDWNARGQTDRETWKKMGEAGYLGASFPPEHGGGGGDFLHEQIIIEELSYARAHALQTSLHTDICLPYLHHYANDAQKQRYLGAAIRGDCLLAIAMTEPGAGSDLAGIQTRARRDGDDFVIDGAKTFISNGQNCDLVIVVAKTDPEAQPAHRGISLLLVPTSAPGFVRGKRLAKLGLRGQDTSEMFFENCRVPSSALLGEAGMGFKYLMTQLQQERLTIAVGSIASCRRALDDTVAYVKERRAFGKPIAAFQNTQFKLAELATQVEVGQCFVDQLCVRHTRGEELAMEASMAKCFTTDLQKRVTSECLQLFGGYGFMLEYPIAMDYADAAVQTIYAGTNEIMKLIIARRMGLE